MVVGCIDYEEQERSEWSGISLSAVHVAASLRRIRDDMGPDEHDVRFIKDGIKLLEYYIPWLEYTATNKARKVRMSSFDIGINEQISSMLSSITADKNTTPHEMIADLKSVLFGENYDEIETLISIWSELGSSTTTLSAPPMKPCVVTWETL